MASDDAERHRLAVGVRVEVLWHKLLRARAAGFSMFASARLFDLHGQELLTCFISPSASRKLC